MKMVASEKIDRRVSERIKLFTIIRIHLGRFFMENQNIRTLYVLLQRAIEENDNKAIIALRDAIHSLQN